MSRAPKPKPEPVPNDQSAPDWIDGINPYVEPDRRAAILATRAERDREIEAWRKRTEAPDG